MSELKEKIQNCLVEHLRMVNSPQEIPVDADLSTLGLTSMAATNLLIDLEDEFNVQFPDSMLTPEVFHSVDSLGEAISSLMNDRVSA